MYHIRLCRDLNVSARVSDYVVETFSAADGSAPACADGRGTPVVSLMAGGSRMSTSSQVLVRRLKTLPKNRAMTVPAVDGHQLDVRASAIVTH